MTRREKSIIGTLALLLIVTAVIFVFPTEEPSKLDASQAVAEPVQSESVTSAPSKGSVILPDDFDWNEQDEAWFEDLLEQVQTPKETHSEWKYEFDETLRPGESLVTDGWEVSEGVFQFTTLTPDEIISDEETLYQISTKVTEVDLSGDAKTLTMPGIVARDGMEASFQSVVGQPAFSNGAPAGKPESGYYLNVTPKGLPQGIRIKGNTSAIRKNP